MSNYFDQYDEQEETPNFFDSFDITRPEKNGGIGAAFGAGVDKVQELGYRAVKGFTEVGDLPSEHDKGSIGQSVAGLIGQGGKLSQFADEGIKSNIAEQANYQPTVPSYKDVDSIGSAASYVGELTANSIPYMAAAMNPVSGFALGGGLSNEAYEAQEEKNPARAVISGFGQMGLEKIGALGSLGKIAQTASKPKNVLIGAMGEGATEVGQDTLAQWGKGTNLSDIDTSNFDEAFVGGAAVGGTLRGGTELFDAARNKFTGEAPADNLESVLDTQQNDSLFNPSATDALDQQVQQTGLMQINGNTSQNWQPDFTFGQNDMPYRGQVQPYVFEGDVDRERVPPNSVPLTNILESPIIEGEFENPRQLPDNSDIIYAGDNSGDVETPTQQVVGNEITPYNPELTPSTPDLVMTASGTPFKTEKSLVGSKKYKDAVKEGYDPKITAVDGGFGWRVEWPKSPEAQEVTQELTNPTETVEDTPLQTEAITNDAAIKPDEVVQNKIEGLEITEAPLNELTLSDDVPQFKDGADQDGVVEKLGGSFDRTGVAPIQVWVREDGRKEVISGRHRLDLARRSDEETIPTQYHYEKDGFDAVQASSLDAILNVRDGQGKVKDYVKYFQANKLTEKEADAAGVLGRATGKRAYAISNSGSDNLIAAHSADLITDEAAYRLSEVAPKEDKYQAVGLKAVQEGKSISYAENLIRAVKSMSGDQMGSDTGDMFGFDDSGMVEAENMAKTAASKQREIKTRLNAIRGAAKNPKLAKAEGVDIKDPNSLNRRISELSAQDKAWDNWHTNPDLVNELRQEIGAEALPVTPSSNDQATIKQTKINWTLTDLKAAGLTPNQYDYNKNPTYFEKEKQISANVKNMTPDEYIDAAVKILQDLNPGATKESILKTRDDFGYLRKEIAAGKPIGMPYLDYKRNQQEGLHRALLAKEMGISDFPVQVITDTEAKAGSTSIIDDMFKDFESAPIEANENQNDMFGEPEQRPIETKEVTTFDSNPTVKVINSDNRSVAEGQIRNIQFRATYNKDGALTKIQTRIAGLRQWVTEVQEKTKEFPNPNISDEMGAINAAINFVDPDYESQNDMFGEPESNPEETKEYSLTNLPEDAQATVDGFFDGDVTKVNAALLDDINQQIDRENKSTRIKAAYKKEGNGLTLKAKGRDAYFTILADPSFPGKFRYQHYDKTGFISHETYSSAEDAIKGAMQSGASEIAPRNTLDKLAATDEFNTGMKSVLAIQQANIKTSTPKQETKLSATGQAFKTEKSARASKAFKDATNPTIVPSGDGFGVQDNPETETTRTLDNAQDLSTETVDNSGDNLDKLATKLGDKKKAAAAELAALIKSQKGTFNSGFNPEVMLAIAKLGGYTIAEGTVNFAQWARDVLNFTRDAGIPDADVTPHLKESYGAIAYNPEKYKVSDDQADSMDSGRVVSKLNIDETLKESESNVSTASDSMEQSSQSQDKQSESINANEDGANGSRQSIGQSEQSTEQEIRSSSESSVSTNDGAVLGAGSTEQLFSEDGAIRDPSETSDTRIDGRSDSDNGARTSTEQGTTAAVDSATKQLTPKTSELKTKGKKSHAVKWGEAEDILSSVPVLMPAQAGDIALIENRFFGKDDPGTGYQNTNGTGTGKTFVGLGMIKRFAQVGKNNVLVVVPNDGIARQWVKAGKDFFGLDLNLIGEKSRIKSSDAGKGITVATYATLGQNNALVNNREKFDLIIPDESQNLMGNQQAKTTKALDKLRVLTNHERARYSRSLILHSEEQASLDVKIKEQYLKILSQYDLTTEAERAAKDYYEPQQKAINAKVKVSRDQLDKEGQFDTKVLFLSATPWPYVKNLDYSEGYVFNYDDYGDKFEGGYESSSDGHNNFYIRNFGYQWRYHKLNRPGAEVDQSLMEREFHENLKSKGVIGGRALEVDADYKRDFIKVETAAGEKLDDLIEIWNTHEVEGEGEFPDHPYRELADALQNNFKYHDRIKLVEAIKAEAAVERAQDHLNMGRKVVIFHSYNVGGSFDPVEKVRYEQPALLAEFEAEFPGATNIDFGELRRPLDVFAEAFGDKVKFYNGDVKDKDRLIGKDQFNQDDSGVDVIVVQQDAGEAGISLHDTTGKHQRVLISIGMPVKPTQFIQIEGRVYRVGVKTDAQYENMTTGTAFERQIFASTIAGRASTAENLAMGEFARSLKNNITEGYLDADYKPAQTTIGKGGKFKDRPTEIDEWDKAKTYYYANLKRNSKTKSAEGEDYFATPEPLGKKMVEWAQAIPGTRLLEPSVGHAAIGRWFPGTTRNKAMEQSYKLSSLAAMNFPGDVVNDTFESLNIINKFETVVMNPPFGKGGSLAYAHIRKAIKHLVNGGRIVALVPDGPAANKKLDALLVDEKLSNIYQAAEVDLPQGVFDRAGTGTKTKIIILDRFDDSADAPQSQNLSFTGTNGINELFDSIKDVDVRQRNTPTVKEVDTEQYMSDGRASKTGYSVKLRGPVNGSITKILNDEAVERFGGKPSRDGQKWIFEVEEQRTDFKQFTAQTLSEAEESGIDLKFPEKIEPLAQVDGQSSNEHFEASGDVYTTKRGKEYPVTEMLERHDKEIYSKLKDLAKELGGWARGQKFMLPSVEDVAQFNELGATIINDTGNPSVMYNRTTTPIKGSGVTKKAAKLAFKRFENEFIGLKDDGFEQIITDKKPSEIFGPELTAADDKDIKGAFDKTTNTLFIFSKNHQSIDDIRRTLREELLTHKGLGIFDDKKIGDLLNRINATRDSDNKDIQAIWKDIDRNYADKSAVIQAEEFLGKVAQDEISVPAKYWNQILASLRILLRKAGLVKDSISLPEMRTVVSEISTKLKQGSPARNYNHKVNKVSDSGLFYNSDKEIAQAKAKGLDMSKAARMKRAKAMGFDTSKVWYHGSNNDISEFEPGRAGMTFFSEDPEYSKMYGNAIYPVYLSLKNPADLIHNSSHRKIAIDAFNELGGWAEFNEDVMDDRDNSNYDESLDDMWEITDYVMHVFEEKGFDGVIQSEDIGDNAFIAIGVSDPENIRSVNAVFDPEYTDSSNIMFNRTGSETVESFTLDDETRTERATRFVQDKFNRIKKTQKSIRESGSIISDEADVYGKEALYYGKVEEDFRQLAENYIDPIAKMLSDKKITQEELDLYLYALHAKERNAHILTMDNKMLAGSGMTDTEADTIIKSVNTDPRSASFKAANRQVRNMIDERVSRMQEHGLIDDETFSSHQTGYANYIPLKGQAKDDGGKPKNTGMGFSVQGRESIAALGRKSKAESPLLHAFTDTQLAIVRGHKNEVSNSMLNLIREVPNDSLWNVYTTKGPLERKKGKDGKIGMFPMSEEKMAGLARNRDEAWVSTKLHGVTHYMKFEDKLLAQQMKNVGVDNGNKITQMLGGINRFLSTMNTSANPEFLITNAVRDVQTAIFNVASETEISDGKIKGLNAEKFAKEAFKSLPKAFMGIRAALRDNDTSSEWGQVFDSFRKNGGKTGYFDVKDIETQTKDLKKLMLMQDKKSLVKYTDKALKFIDDYNATVENGIRLTVYKTALDNGVTEHQAAVLAKNLTVNFNRKGEAGTWLNSLYLFANAGIQGTANFARAIGTFKIDENGKKKLNLAQKAGIAMGGIAFSMAVMNRMIAEDDEDGESFWDKVPNHVKERNFVLMTGGRDYITLPMPYGYNVFANFGTAAESIMMGGKISKNASFMARAIMGSFLPLGLSQGNDGLETTIKTVMPQIGKPLIDLSTNTNFFGGKIYNDNNEIFGDKRSDAGSGYDRTNSFFKSVAMGLNSASGGTEYQSGVVDVHPESIRYLAQYIGGGAGSFVLNTAETVARTAKGEFDKSKTPFVRRGFGVVKDYSDQSAFYDHLDEVETFQAEFKSLRGPAKLEFGKENRDILKISGLAKSTKDYLSDMRKRKKSFQSRSMSVQVEKMDELMETRIDRFNKKYNEIMDKR